jgi:hypothetical protein
MKGDRFKTGGLLLMLPFFLLSGFRFSDPVRQSSVSDPKNTEFGMRMRERKPGGNVFAPTFIEESPGNEATMVRWRDETLKIFYINRPGSADKLMSKASLDNGLSWKARRVEFDLPGEAYYANQVLLGKDQELHCVFHIFDRGANGYRNRHLNLWYSKTENNQQKWTEPQEIYDGYVGSIRGFIQLENGRLIMAFAKAVPEREQRPQSGVDYGWNEIISLHSDDNGATWERSDNALTIAVDGSKTTRYGAVEPSIIELRDGRIWMLIRTTKGYLYESYSDDSGDSWHQPQRTHFISSDSPADLLRLSDNRLILLWSANQRWDDERSYAMGGREVLHGAISSDDGKTWKGFREVLTAPVGNGAVRGDRGTACPSADETAGKKVAFVSGQGEAKSIVLFHPDWLEELSAQDDFSEGLVQWTLYDADSLTRLIPLRDKNVLHIRKSAIRKHADTEAVWNFPMLPKGELTAEIEMKKGHKGISLALTDHFSISGDTLASRNAVVHFALGENINRIARKSRNRLSVRITWDTEKKKASLFLNDTLFSEQEFARQPVFGLNYLRVGISGKEEDLSGFYLHSVKVVDTRNGH